jgi:MinD superfamily P-loop ATPase
MVHATMGIGADNSGKLVARVKAEAKEIGQKENKSIMLVDGSPGTGCPVVSALAGANYALLVTEPTMSGLHDLKRVVKVIQRTRMKMGCIINKSDLNPSMTDEIHQFLVEENITLLADLHFDTEFNKAMILKKTIVETDSPIKLQIEDAWGKIVETISKK